MLYKKNLSPELSEELFKNPSSEYRGAPFWAWNSKLDKDELARQIKVFNSMGFGGFHMHVRQGLETPYLSEDFLDCVRFCAEQAEKNSMLAYLYDEDRWPSGVAGGFVTKKPENRQKYLTMTVTERADCALTAEESAKTGKPYLVATFDVSIAQNGEMVGYKKIEKNTPSKNKKYFYLEQKQGGEPRFNYQAYVDTLSKDAIDEFISTTHEKFKKCVGDKFGKSVPAIFTDEPQVFGAIPPRSGFCDKDAYLSWTTDFNKTFFEEYNFDLTDYLPELFYATDDEHAYKTRFCYYTHLSERFCVAYMDNIGNWCAKNGIAMTGHAVGEDALYETLLQTADVMREYKNMQIPGIDILCDDVVFNTPIQCRSIVRQYGREAMLSELYGVTGWDFDFRGHKYQGDWQAALGVTVRVPHLAWQSMKGEGKRDYPACISYQSAWYDKYKYIEDHYARINTAMTRGKPDVKIAVIYPIDTYKIAYASFAETSALRNELDDNFKNTTEWLLKGGYDFDFISESLLPDLCSNGSNPLLVGKMEYDTVIVSDCMTLRPHTIKVLNQFKKSGGKLIFKGRLPYLCNGEPSESAKNVIQGATVIHNSKADLYRELKNQFVADIRDEFGAKTENLMCSMRIDGLNKWLFIAHMFKPKLPHTITKQKISVRIKGVYKPLLFDTLSGEIKRLPFDTDQNSTVFYTTLYDLDTLLVKFVPTYSGDCLKENITDKVFNKIQVPFEVDYALSVPNVLLLDMAKYSVDNEELINTEEIMRIDNLVRKKLNLQSRRTKFVQPWAVSNSPEEHNLKLVYTVESEIDIEGVALALEHPESTTIKLNGKLVENTVTGYYVDKDIKTVALPKITKGANELELSMPFGLRTDVEACYLIGNFGTTYIGRKTKLISRPKTLSFGDVTRQGFAFYGGNVIYNTKISLDKNSDIKVTVSHYRGAAVSVLLDGKEVGIIAFSPFTLNINGVKKGEHSITYILHGTRYNTFSALHNLDADGKRNYIGPDYWRTANEGWAYEYTTRPMGILKTPIVEVSPID